MTYKELAKRLRLIEYQFDVYHVEDQEVTDTGDVDELIELVEQLKADIIPCDDDCPF